MLKGYEILCPHITLYCTPSLTEFDNPVKLNVQHYDIWYNAVRISSTFASKCQMAQSLLKKSAMFGFLKKKAEISGQECFVMSKENNKSKVERVYDQIVSGYTPSEYVNTDWKMRDGVYPQYSVFENNESYPSGTSKSIQSLCL